MPTGNLDLIYEKWKASLREKDRSREFVSSNFDELFDAFNSAGATFEEAHAYLQQAIKVHLPSPGLARATWKMVKGSPNNAEITEKEFIDGWHKDIGDKATNSFYHVYPLPEEQDHDGEPKVYGSMSAKEYKLQRKHADSYPVLDTEELERRLQSEVYNPVEDILGEDDGHVD
jgi:predicted RNase H-like HicB family nuclease